MYFNELDSRTIRDKVDLIEAFEEWHRTREMIDGPLAGTMGYEERSGELYLYRRLTKAGARTSRSLGPKTPENDRILSDFLSRKKEASQHLSSLSSRIDELASIMRALNHQRIPSTAAKIIRKLNESSIHDKFRLAGTYAMYAYEAAASVTFQNEIMATNDVDILVDDRSPLRIVINSNRTGFEAMAKSVDPSFGQRFKGDYRLTNKDGFMVEFIRPESVPPHRLMPGEGSGVPGDVKPVAIPGLQWLLSAPSFTSVAIDDRGYPVRLRAPAPAIWAAHKLWLSHRPDRDPGKAQRDQRQATAVLDLIEKKLPLERIDERLHSSLPKALADLIPVPVRPSSDTPATPHW